MIATKFDSFCRGRDTNDGLKLVDSALHLHQARIRCIGVVMEDIDLLVELGVGLLLVRVLSLDLLSKLVLLVERLVLGLDDVHLEDGAARVLLRRNDVDLATVVLQLRNDVDQHLLKALKLSAESHRLLALKAKDSSASDARAQGANTSHLAELALRAVGCTALEAARVEAHRDVLALDGVVLARDLRLRLLALLAGVLRDVRDDRLALITGTRHKDVLAGVSMMSGNFDGLLREHWLHSRLLKVLVRAVLRAIKLWLLVCIDHKAYHS